MLHYRCPRQLPDLGCSNISGGWLDGASGTRNEIMQLVNGTVTITSDSPSSWASAHGTILGHTLNITFGTATALTGTLDTTCHEIMWSNQVVRYPFVLIENSHCLVYSFISLKMMFCEIFGDGIVRCRSSFRFMFPFEMFPLLSNETWSSSSSPDVLTRIIIDYDLIFCMSTPYTVGYASLWNSHQVAWTRLIISTRISIHC